MFVGETNNPALPHPNPDQNRVSRLQENILAVFVFEHN